MPDAGHKSVVVLADVGGEAFHVGDEAMLEANLRLLRREAPQTAVTVLGRGADLNTIAAALADADGALISGGGNLSASWPELLEQRIVLLEEASRQAVPVVVGGQTIGPVLDDPHRGRLGVGLANAALVGVRELPSTRLALELGVDAERLVYQVDDAFDLPGVPPDDDAVRRLAETDYLAVTLDGSYAADASASGLRSLASQIAVLSRELALRVVFVPHVGVLGECDGEDTRAGGRLASLLRLAGVECVLAPVLPVGGAVWLAHGAALTISSRYHPLVFAAAAGRPCLGLYRDRYTQAKLRGALTHVNAEYWCLETSSAEAGRLTPAVRALWAAREAVAERMGRAHSGIALREAHRHRRLIGELGLGPATRDPASEMVLGWGARDLALTSIGRADVEDPVPVLSVGSPPVRRSGVPAVGPASSGAPLTDEEWDRFSREGLLHLGRVLEPAAVERLAHRAGELANGRVVNEHVQFGSDGSMNGLEMDDEFVALIRNPRFLDAGGRTYGRHVPLSVLRAMSVDQQADEGAHLSWHQDGGDARGLDREPLLTIWVALDPISTASWWMEAVPGSHRLGLLSTNGTILSAEDAVTHCLPQGITPLEVRSGHAVLLHNWLIRRLRVDQSPRPGRAVAIELVDGRSRDVETGDHLGLVAGAVDPSPHPYVRDLASDASVLRDAVARAEEYALSLEAALGRERSARTTAEVYARSLEAGREDRAGSEQADSVAAPTPPAGWRERRRLRR